MSPTVRRRATLVAAAAASLLAGAPRAAAGQTPRAAPRPVAAGAPAALTALTAAVRREVVDTIAAQLRRHYVDADTGRMIAEHVRRRLASGAYDAVTDPYLFAERLGGDLRAVNGDGHLYVVYDPSGRAGMRVGPEGIRMLGPPPGADGPRRREPPPEMVAEARRMHFGLGRVDVLPGNVGYLDVRGFSGAPEAREAVVDALRYVQHTDAMIIDLRRNGGGSAGLVNFLISHFTGSDTLPSLTVRNRSGNETFTRYTLASVPGPRRPAVPLYVLTSGFTASAGEDFAFVLRNLGRATVVGGVTAGAGHNNATLDVGHGFGASISFSRTTDPKTGAEWERVGVQPTVAVDQAQALDVAHALALKAIAERTTEPQRRRVLELTREAIEAQRAAPQVSAAALAQYAGEYAGGRTLAVEGGRLTYLPRRGAPADALVPMGADSFGNGPLRIAFEREGGSVARMRVTQPGGASLTYPRVK